MPKPHIDTLVLGCQCAMCEAIRWEAEQSAHEKNRAEASHRIGASIRAAREAAGKTLRSVARRLGVAPTFLSTTETGKNRPLCRQQVFRIINAIKTAK